MFQIICNRQTWQGQLPPQCERCCFLKQPQPKSTVLVVVKMCLDVSINCLNVMGGISLMMGSP